MTGESKHSGGRKTMATGLAALTAALVLLMSAATPTWPQALQRPVGGAALLRGRPRGAGDAGGPAGALRRQVGGVPCCCPTWLRGPPGPAGHASCKAYRGHDCKG